MSQTPPPSQTIDPYKHLHLLRNPDNTITRLLQVPHTSPSSDTTLPTTVLTKDITINQTNKTWVRLFLPNKPLPNNQKLPLVVFFHGSGFILASAGSTMFHDFCVNMVDEIGVFVVSVGYRLAPEHRLPAAYDDAMEALFWIKSMEDEWLTRYADYSKCYLMGKSAGATIAYHAGLRTIEAVKELEPIKIQGLILRQPFFGGKERTESELKLVNDPIVPLCVTDLMWELALPIGADRDHEYCNPRIWNVLEKFDKIRDVGWKVLVSGNDGDPMVDREKELAQLMEEKGVHVVKDFEEGCHATEYYDPLKARKLIDLIKGFIS
ncbi:carboxylesterase 1-like [Vicia villosa]|uniref:carboxylesterase 1-like n=1 Tax=Vicia villosa TaxID=3911 RepID=UPI00273AB900|nr:carboxylesterase 1-like [Vicia villosa]